MDESWRKSKPSTSGAAGRAAFLSDVSDDSDGDIDDGASETSASSSSTDSENCPICLNRLRKQIVGNPECCDHLFCFDCISEWSKCTTTCPIDRLPFTSIVTKDLESGRILKQEKVENRVARDEEIEEHDATYCEVCHRSDREDRMLLCDTCDQGYHLECLTPPLNAVPLGAWFCPNCNTRDLPGSRRQRRAIPRTRANERVRARIANQLINEYSDVSHESSADEISGESNYDSDDAIYSLPSNIGLQSSSVARKPTRRRRRRKRRVCKKRRTRKSFSGVTSKEGKGTPRVKRRRRRRRKNTRRRFPVALKRSNSDPNLSRSGKLSNGKIKKRLADRLGIAKPPKKGQHFPEMKAVTSSADLPSNGQLSIFEDRNALIAFSDENDISCDELGSLGNAEVAISEKARRFRTPFRPTRKASTAAGVQRQQAAQPEAVPLDLLGGIMEGQALLMAPSSKVTIKRDGSLAEKSRSAGDFVKDQSKSSIVDQAMEGKMDVCSKSLDSGEKRALDERESSGNIEPTSSNTSKRANEEITENRELEINKRMKITHQDSQAAILGAIGGRQSGQNENKSASTSRNERSDAYLRNPSRDHPQSAASHQTPSDGSYLQCIHPPPSTIPKQTAATPPVRKKGPLLPSPSVLPTKSAANDISRQPGLRRKSPAAADSDSGSVKQQSSTNAPARYAVAVSLPAASSPPMVEEMSPLQSNSAAMIAAQIQQNFQQQQNLLAHQQQSMLGMGQCGGRLSPVRNDEVGHHDFAMHLLNGASAAGQQQLLLSAHQHLSAADRPSLENLLSATVGQAFLAPQNLAAAAAMQNALATAAARQHQMNLLSTLRAGAVASTQPQFQPGFIPAFATAGGMAPGALYPGHMLPHIWQQQMLTTQQPPPPAAPPPPPPPVSSEGRWGSRQLVPPPDLQLIPLPPPPFSVCSGLASTAPPPPPPVPPPALSNNGRGSRMEYDDGAGRQSLDARLSEIEMDNNVPPELLSLLQQFAQIKKEQQQNATSRDNLRASENPKSSHTFVAIAVSPASSINSPLVLDMAVTTPTPEPVEPTPATRADKKTRTKNSVKFGADVVEADERKVKLSKAEIKQKKREGRLRKMLQDAAKPGRRNSNDASGDMENDDGVPSSAVDLKRREKVLAKFNYQLQVEEAVKVALRPYYSKRKITKDEYKEIMRKCVPKICKKKAEIKAEKIKAFVDSCVAKVLAERSKRGATGGDD